MAHQLDYRRPEKRVGEPIGWTDLRRSIWIQAISLVVVLIVGSRLFLLLFAVSAVMYWIGVAVIAVRGVRGSWYGADQIFLRWGFLILCVALSVCLFAILTLAL